MNLVFNTKLSKSECVRKIKLHAGKSTVLDKFTSIGNFNHEFLYKISGDNLELEKVIHYRNSFKPIFYGKLKEENRETIIEGSFNTQAFVKIFMIVWFGGTVLIGVPLFLAALIKLLNPHSMEGIFYGDPLVGILVPIFMPIFGIVLIKVGQWLGKKQEKEVIEFIEKFLEAKLTINQK